MTFLNVNKYIICYCWFALPLLTFGQEVQKQTNEGLPLSTESQSIIPLSKQSLLKDVDVIFNSRISLDNNFEKGEHKMTNFNVSQFRLEIKGKIHDRIFFRFRDRYTKETTPGNLDNISRSTDFALISIDLSKQTKLSVGKMISDFGGYEIEFNPIDILNYNTIIKNSDIFFVGASISHALKDDKNKFDFQLLNSRTNTFAEQYGATAPPEMVASKFPLAVVLNWRSSFFDKKWSTTYSYSYYNEAQNVGMNYLAFGNKFKAKKWVLFYDFKWTNEGLDRKGVVSKVIANKYLAAAQGVEYIENWVRAEYQIAPKVSVLMTLMSSKSYWNKNPDINGTNHILTSYGFIPTVQYFPFKDVNLKFYVAYIANTVNYSDYAQKEFNARNTNTGQLSFGFISPLLVL